MHTFAQKPKAPQQATPAKATLPARAPVGHHQEMDAILHLQRTIGNQAMQRMLQTHAGEPEARSTAAASPRFAHDFSRIPVHSSAPTPIGIQPKLMVNTPGDIYEQEADRISKQVMATPAHHAVSSTPPRIQRFSGQATGQTDAAPASVDQALASPGRPLEPALQQDMEQRFGHDFSQVRVHTDAAAEQSAQDVHANAYTVGHNMVFGAGRFAPGTHDGRRLIAHELTHVVQQRLLDQAGGVVRSPGKPLDPDVQAGAEQRLGIDLSRVRIHDDEAAAASADAARARAYTVGSHIAFGRGEYRPHDADGRRVMLHELAHVAQQGAKDNALHAPRWIVRSEDAAEREAHEFANHAGPISSWQPNHRTSGAGLARYPKEGQELQERASEALQHGLDPSSLGSKPLDWIHQQMKDPYNAFVPPPVQTVPGSWIQQEDALPEVNSIELFNQPAIHDAMQAIAEGAEATEAAKPGGKVEHSVDKLMPYWQQHFVNSVDYILFRRSGDHREARLKALHEAEKKLIQANPSDLISQVEALRAKAAAAWQAEVQTAAQRFLEIAANEAKWATIHQNAVGVKVFGLPESIEGSVKAEDNKETIEFDPRQPITVSPSVVRFMKQLQPLVQKITNSRVLAENYPRHELFNPFVGDITGIGKYSFDIHPGITVDDNTGFYEHKKMVEFFKAVDRAAVETKIAWVAFYNDFEVAKEVNENLGKMHVGFSGGGGPKTGNPGPGSFHHGPAPYILHVHFNIMPIDLKEQFDRAQLIKGAIKKILPFILLQNPSK